jgi:thiamine biosynthesis lipoprotein
MSSYRLAYPTVQSAIHAILICAATILVPLVSLGCGSGSSHLSRFEYAQLHMGVQVRLTVYAPDQATAERACTAAYERIAALEDVMSDYRPKSELMRLCARAGEGPIPVSKDLFEVLDKSQEFSRRSEGAFDITVGPYVALWRTARKTGKLPTTQQIAEASKSVGWQKVVLDPAHQTVQLLAPNMKLDLGGIGKGYAGDAAIACLKSHGVDSALFVAGGDIVARNAPPGKRGWMIQVMEGSGKSRRRFVLHNGAVSTSGDTEQFVIVDGKRYSHVVDPRTGIGLTQRIEATVAARDGTTSDALSKIPSIMGMEKGAAVVRSYEGTEAYIRVAR